jgi:hypothetical protein
VIRFSGSEKVVGAHPSEEAATVFSHFETQIIEIHESLYPAHGANQDVVEGEEIGRDPLVRLDFPVFEVWQLETLRENFTRILVRKRVTTSFPESKHQVGMQSSVHRVSSITY